MGLKVFTGMIAYFSSSKIKSDQNGIERTKLNSSELNSHSDKIRPKWDWKSFLLTLLRTCSLDKIRPKWDWKVNLPCISFLSALLIKSDQNGIESRWFCSHTGLYFVWIKSDQNGIESLLISLAQLSLTLIKSDQNGIESTYTIMSPSLSSSIKSDQNGIESFDSCNLFIVSLDR